MEKKLAVFDFNNDSIYIERKKNKQMLKIICLSAAMFICGPTVFDLSKKGYWQYQYSQYIKEIDVLSINKNLDTLRNEYNHLKKQTSKIQDLFSLLKSKEMRALIAMNENAQFEVDKLSKQFYESSSASSYLIESVKDQAVLVHVKLILQNKDLSAYDKTQEIESLLDDILKIQNTFKNKEAGPKDGPQFLDDIIKNLESLQQRLLEQKKNFTPQEKEKFDELMREFTLEEQKSIESKMRATQSLQDSLMREIDPRKKTKPSINDFDEYHDSKMNEKIMIYEHNIKLKH